MMLWTFTLANWFSLLAHFGSLSLLSIGAGALTTAPQMYQFLVDQMGWITPLQFNSSITIAQSSPGPNVLFVALFGWNVGSASGNYFWGIVAMMTALVGFLLPSSIATIHGTRWVRRNQKVLLVRAFKLGLTPISAGLLASIGLLLLEPYKDASNDWPLWLMTALTTLAVWKTRIHLVWLLGMGAGVGVLVKLFWAGA